MRRRVAPNTCFAVTHRWGPRGCGQNVHRRRERHILRHGRRVDVCWGATAPKSRRPPACHDLSGTEVREDQSPIGVSMMFITAMSRCTRLAVVHLDDAAQRSSAPSTMTCAWVSNQQYSSPGRHAAVEVNAHAVWLRRVWPASRVMARQLAVRSGIFRSSRAPPVATSRLGAPWRVRTSAETTLAEWANHRKPKSGGHACPP